LSTRWTRPRVLGLALGLYAAITFAGIQTYPRVWVDEGWIAEPGWSLARGAPMGSPSHGEAVRYEDRVFWMTPLHFLVLGGIYKLGADPLLGGRLVSGVAGFLTLAVLLAWVSGALREKTRAGWTPALAASLLWLALAFTLDPTLWKSHRTIRFESLVSLGVVSAVALAWDPSRRFRGAVSGLAAGLAISVHPNGALAFAAVAGIFFLKRRTFAGSVRDLLLASAAACLVVLPTALYFFADRASGFANVLGQNAPHLSGEPEPPGATWLREWQRYRAYFAWPALAVPLLFWVAAAAAALRSGAPRALWWTLAVLAGGLASLPNKTEHYLTLVAPFVFVLAAFAGAARPSRRVAGAAIAWLGILLAADAVLLRRAKDCDYAAWASSLAEPVPDGASVAGTFLGWFPLRDHPYLEVHRRLAGDLADRRPDYVAWGDAHLRDPLFDRLRRELGPFLAVHADTVATAASDCYGDAVLLRPRWEELPAEAASWERWDPTGRAD